jgi:predicted DNA-binding antitoxin AbrB/MazE fold protein
MADLKTNAKLGWSKRLEMINLIVTKLKPLTNIEVRQGEKTSIKQSENNTVIEVSGGIPEGYEETDIILCQNGSPVNGKILFNPD